MKKLGVIAACLLFLAGCSKEEKVVVPEPLSDYQHHISGQKLYEACTSQEAGPYGMCFGVIIGVVDYQQWYFAYRGDKYLCYEPSNTTDYIGTVTRFLEANPTRRHQGAAALVNAAIAEAHGCKASK